MIRPMQLPITRTPGRQRQPKLVRPCQCNPAHAHEHFAIGPAGNAVERAEQIPLQTAFADNVGCIRMNIFNQFGEMRSRHRLACLSIRPSPMQSAVVPVRPAAHGGASYCRGRRADACPRFRESWKGL